MQRPYQVCRVEALVHFVLLRGEMARRVVVVWLAGAVETMAIRFAWRERI
jgi:hypothetical protein